MLERTGNRLVKVLARLALLVCLGAAQAQGRPVIEWTVMDLPPSSIPVNGQLTDGLVDVILKMVFAEMPEYEHRITVTPIARTWVSLADGAPTCFTTALITPERERIAYTTLVQLTPPPQLVVSADAAARIPRNGKGEVPPSTLFSHGDLRGVVTPLRSYGATLDALLAQRPAQSGIREVAASGSGSNILEMLSKGRADYTVEFDYVLRYQQSRFPDSVSGKLLALPIAGMQPIPTGIACPRTEWGRKMIVRIDAILARISQRPEYQRAKDRWLSADTIKRYQKAEAEFFRSRAYPSDAAKYPSASAVRPEK